jgi:hypothetical protein
MGFKFHCTGLEPQVSELLYCLVLASSPFLHSRCGQNLIMQWVSSLRHSFHPLLQDSSQVGTHTKELLLPGHQRYGIPFNPQATTDA